MKRVLIIHESMGGGGAERVLVTLLNSLVETGRYDITLLLICKDGPFYSQIPAGIKVISLFDNYNSVSYRILNHFRPIRNYVRKRFARHNLGRRKFDVTISFMEGPAAKIHSQLMDYAPVNLSWVHCNQKVSRWYDQWFKIDEEKQFYQAVDKVAFVSKDVEAAFNDLYATNAKKVVIYNPTDIKYIQWLSEKDKIEKDDIFTIINVGRLVWQKNQSKLIEVAELLRSRGRRFRMIIIGDGVLRNELSADIRKKDLVSYIRLVGFKENPFAIIKSADLFCLTSVSEGWGMVIVEALSLSVPVVAAPIGAVSEIFSYGGGGMMTDGSTEGYADAIEFLMDNPERLQQMSESASNTARIFDVDSVLSTVTNFIND